MEIFVLIGSFTIVCLLGMPVAYALGNCIEFLPPCGSASRLKP